MSRLRIRIKMTEEITKTHERIHHLNTEIDKALRIEHDAQLRQDKLAKEKDELHIKLVGMINSRGGGRKCQNIEMEF